MRGELETAQRVLIFFVRQDFRRQLQGIGLEEASLRRHFRSRIEGEEKTVFIQILDCNVDYNVSTGSLSVLPFCSLLPSGSFACLAPLQTWPPGVETISSKKENE